MSQPRTAVARPARPSAALGLVLVIVLTLVAGCGVRLETPPPAAPSPDAQESARQRASADAVALEVLAGPADAPPDPAADPLGAARAAVAADARVHLDALGGLYHPDPATTPPADGDDTRTTTGTSTRTDTGTAADATGASPTPGTAAAPVPEPAPAAPEVLASALTEAAATARADADAVADGPLARLLASIAVNRLLAADRLADASGLAAPRSRRCSSRTPHPRAWRARTCRHWSRARTPRGTRWRSWPPSTGTTSAGARATAP
ncbi:hypothetical protein [Cellulomonas sp. ATA003]|uniref:hypothetical protein n=1 Tax=Cellulomonas sp. ATA003 TaxID=3073064 RepID=UPI0028737577|nr:hypothetical protein [Cellulomonas sp. ATA003]WNB84908.1 hypothetical protein REH70_14485 [Cellulomonas sp. ATA003]